MESAASGILAAKNLVRALQGKVPLLLPADCMLGALSRYMQRRKYRRLSADGRQHGNFAAVARAGFGTRRFAMKKSPSGVWIPAGIPANGE